VAYPAGSYGYSQPYYSQPYYSDPGPVVVQPNVYLEGNYYSRPRYPYGYYNGHPGYYSHPGYSQPRPGWGGRPSAVAPPAVHGGRPDGVAGNLVPVPPGRSRSEVNRMLMSPDSRNQTPP
jgi:hypothetical protein